MDTSRNNLTRKYFYTKCKILYFLGAPNFWFEEFDVPSFFGPIQNYFSKIVVSISFVFIVTELLALFTQNNLSEKQTADLTVFVVSHPILLGYILSVDSRVKQIRNVLYSLTEGMKKVFNDEEVERRMVRKAKFFSTLVITLFSMTLFLYGVGGLVQVMYADGTFVTVITVWPDVADPSPAAHIVRIMVYIIWWVFVIRMSTIFSLVVPLTVCLSYQYKQLCSYFYSLNAVFDKICSQSDKEKEYEKGFVLGIQLHSKTLWCTRECEKISRMIFGGQIMINVIVLILLMLQMVNSERTLSNALATLSTASSVLIGTGCFIWNAGDVTVEASNLATAMYGSGWENCRRQAAVRIRPMLLIAMCQSQRPVEMRCFGVVRLSYGSYLSIVKSSYSVFSVLY